ncbi:hypothetical protein OsJ_28100 [Oryza sativa Japonica Group]|uniref:Uncharacterized protein n=1 Tax=Oryza sativa subsp. japonica TaxID=39947 RepID=Q6ZD42_ORYSJ|nr:hypothetical protein OsJ_28100 [Oryza sativa Japonica Group]BAD01235.1 hypothetical protein [Oryza sativa Japonica Group]
MVSDSRNSLILFGLWELSVHLCKLITLTTIKVRVDGLNMEYCGGLVSNKQVDRLVPDSS